MKICVWYSLKNGGYSGDEYVEQMDSPSAGGWTCTVEECFFGSQRVVCAGGDTPIEARQKLIAQIAETIDNSEAVVVPEIPEKDWKPKPENFAVLTNKQYWLSGLLVVVDTGLTEEKLRAWVAKGGEEYFSTHPSLKQYVTEASVA